MVGVRAALVAAVLLLAAARAAPGADSPVAASAIGTRLLAIGDAKDGGGDGGVALDLDLAHLRRRVEFFSHIMHTGGTAWSRWLAAAYGADTVAPGSADAAPMYSGKRSPFSPQFDLLKNATESCASDPRCRAPEYAVAFGHRTPGFLVAAGLDPSAVYVATLLRDPVDMAIHVNMARVCYEAQLAGANASLPQAARDRFQTACQPSMVLGEWMHRQQLQHHQQQHGHHQTRRGRGQAPVQARLGDGRGDGDGSDRNTSLGALRISADPTRPPLQLRSGLSQVDWLVDCAATRRLPLGGGAVGGGGGGGGGPSTGRRRRSRRLDPLNGQPRVASNFTSRSRGATATIRNRRNGNNNGPAASSFANGHAGACQRQQRTDDEQLAAAVAALAAMPWFGITRHWIGSTCLWHHVHHVPFPPSRSDSDGNRDGGGKAPTWDNYSSVRAAQHYIRETSPTAAVRDTLLLLRAQRLAAHATGSAGAGGEGGDHGGVAGALDKGEGASETTLPLGEDAADCDGTACLAADGDSAFLDLERRLHTAALQMFTERMARAALDLATATAATTAAATAVAGRRRRTAAGSPSSRLGGEDLGIRLPALCFEAPPPDGFAQAGVGL